MYSNNAVFLFRNSTLVSFWSLKIHIRLTQRVTQFTAWWKVYLELKQVNSESLLSISWPWFLLPCWFEENINLRRNGRTDKEKKENIRPTEEKKNRKEKKQIFGQRKYLVHGKEKERRRKMRKTFGVGNDWLTTFLLDQSQQRTQLLKQISDLKNKCAALWPYFHTCL